MYVDIYIYMYIHTTDITAQVKTEWARLKELGYGQQKEQKQNKLIQAWKLGGWEHPKFTHIISLSSTETRGKVDEGVPLQRMRVLMGGRDGLTEAPGISRT